MRIIRAKDYAEMSRKAANIIAAQVVAKPDCVLGLATGGTPVGTYKTSRRAGGKLCCCRCGLDHFSS